MSKIYEKLESYLSGEEWRRHAFNAIDAIPYGHVATYGYIASQVESQTGSNPGSRNVAKLRRRLYGILSHDTTLLDYNINPKAQENDHSSAPGR